MSTRSRARKTFKYPSEDDDDLNDADLDEEHQETLITSLRSADAFKTTLYRNLFLSIPLLGALYFLYSLLIFARTAQQSSIALLGVSSLLCTAYILRYLPVEEEVRDGGEGGGRRREDVRGPVEKYLVLLNGVLAGLMLLAAGVSWRRGDVETGWREALPAMVLGLVMVVRGQLAPVDLDELERARFEYKGA